MEGYTVAEVAGVVFGVLYVWLAVRENVWCWPAGLANALIFFFVFFHARLYGAAFLQVVYMALSVYGWRQWLRGGTGGGRLTVSRTPPAWAFGLGVAVIASSVLFGAYLHFRTDAALPFTDAATTMTSLAAQWMTTRKWLESWIVWIAVDVVYVGMYVSQALYVTVTLYIVFLVLAVLGYREWRNAMRESAG